MTDIGKYLDFVILIFLAFGLAFEVPIVTVVLVKMDVTTPETLAKKRPYVIVGAFVVGMLLTPPDIISQVMLAVPVWMLFELGLFLSKFMEKGSSKNDAHDQNGEESRYRPLSEEEMEAELDAIEREEQASDNAMRGSDDSKK